MVWGGGEGGWGEGGTYAGGRRGNKWSIVPSTTETGRLQDDFGNLIDFVQKLHRMKVCY